jgi:monovalent cation:proton antiporter-2 (CPA2) family protein
LLINSEEFFFQAFIYLLAAVVSVPIAKRLGLGSVLGYLIAGVLIGPHVLRLVGHTGNDVRHVAEFGVVMMLFLVGLELRPNLLWKLRGPILGAGGLQLLATTIVFAALSMSAGLPPGVAIAIGMIFSASSTAIALQSLTERGQLPTRGGQTSFSVLLFQDLSVIPILAILPLLASQPHAITSSGPTESAAGPWLRALVIIGVVGAIVLGGRFLVRPIFRYIALTRLHEIFNAAALLLVVGIALAMELVGLSPALGTFLAGVVLAESEYRHELEADIEPFKGLLLGLFFISVGASIDLPLIQSQPFLIALLVLGLLVIKFAVLFLSGNSQVSRKVRVSRLPSRWRRGVSSLSSSSRLLCKIIFSIKIWETFWSPRLHCPWSSHRSFSLSTSASFNLGSAAGCKPGIRMKSMRKAIP